MKNMNFYLVAAYKQRMQLDRKQKRTIRKYYKKVLNDLKAEILKLPPLSKDTTISEFAKRTQLQQIEILLTDSMVNVGVAEDKIIRKSMKEVCDIVINANKNFMTNVGFPKEIVSESFQNVPNKVIERVVTGQLYPKNWSLSKDIWKDVKRNQQSINEIIANGISLNKSSFDIAKDLETFVKPEAQKPWDWKKVYPNSNRKIDYNAQRLARTMVSHAYQQAFEETIEPNPFVDGVKWNLAHTGRECEICIERATKDHYGLGKGVYPKGKVPVDHPNGMCFLTTVQDDIVEIAKRVKDWSDGLTDNDLEKYIKEIDPNYLK